MSLVIIKPGVLDTIQDLGRTGYASFGLNPGGAMDRFAAKLANILTGNDINEAVMEIHFPGPQLLFEEDVLVSITGADFGPTLNDELLPCWQPILIRKNTVMQFPDLKWGARAYLAVQGGFRLDRWLNSYSTHLKAGMGGWKGGKLEKKDELFFKNIDNRSSALWRSEDNFQLLPWRPDIGKVYQDQRTIHFIQGNEWPALSPEAKTTLMNSRFAIQSSSDRMGYQLKGNTLESQDASELVSSAVNFGTIQLLPNGQLIILMADHQTTGGYPRVGHVISAHLPKLAQLNPGDAIHFRPVGIDAAEELLILQQQELQIVQRACDNNLMRYYALQH